MRGDVSDSSNGRAPARGRSASTAANKSARHCRVDGCNVCLLREKKFYRRSRCCQMHARELKVSLNGEQRRFCQQCCGFHELSAFDGTKRSCRERLESHNSRQREKWTVGGRRRGGAPKTVGRFSLPSKIQLVPEHSGSGEDLHRVSGGSGAGDSEMVDMQHPQNARGEPDFGPPQPFAASCDVASRMTGSAPEHQDNSPFATPSAVAAYGSLPGCGTIGGLSGGTVLGSSPLRPPRARRTLRSKSDKTGICTSDISQEHAYSWLKTGAAANPRPMLDFSREQASDFGGRDAGDSLPLYKHNSIDAADVYDHEEPAMAFSGPLSAQLQPNGRHLKRLSFDSAVRDRDASDGSAASGSGHWPSDEASPDRIGGADRYKRRCSLDATMGSVRPSQLGLFSDNEARAFAAQAPDPLWLAQRLVGEGLSTKTRPEYSYANSFARRSQSAAAQLADSLDAAVAGARFEGLPSMPPALQEAAGAAKSGADGFASPPGSSAANFGPSHMSPDEQGQAQAFFFGPGPPASDVASSLPDSYRRHSARECCGAGPPGPPFTPSLLADLSLAPDWATNEATLASAAVGAATMAALMGDIREEHAAFDGAPPNAFVGHLADSSWGAPASQGFELDAPPLRRQRTVGFADGLPGVAQPPPLASLGPLGLAAMGKQTSAPPMGMGCS